MVISSALPVGFIYPTVFVTILVVRTEYRTNKITYFKNRKVIVHPFVGELPKVQSIYNFTLLQSAVDEGGVWTNERDISIIEPF
jgi:hypothetical protein